MKVWGLVQNGKYRIESITKDTLNGALQVLRESFCMDEAVCLATDMPHSPKGQRELELLSLDTIRDGVSLVAVTNDDIAKVVAIAFNKLQTPPEPNEQSYFDNFQNEICHDESSKSLINFMIAVDAKINLFEMYDVDCILEIMFVATLREHRNQGLANELSRCSWFLGKEIRINRSAVKRIRLDDFKPLNEEAITKIPGICSAIFTSSTSQKLGDNLGFDVVLEVPYDEFYFKGKSFSAKIGPESPVTKLCAKIIE